MLIIFKFLSINAPYMSTGQGKGILTINPVGVQGKLHMDSLYVSLFSRIPEYKRFIKTYENEAINSASATSLSSTYALAPITRTDLFCLSSSSL
jgi:hypothetical protein